MVNTKLIVVEGLPGSGKSTTARLIQDILKEKKSEPKLYLEGNVDHPADYEYASYFTKDEFANLLEENLAFKEHIINHAEEQSGGYVLYRPKLNEGELSESLRNKLWEHDIYELPLEKNMELIMDKWKRLCDQALTSKEPFIFECCFIQNPVTIGMIKYGASEEVVMNYVKGLAEIIQPLNPVLVYVEQKDLSNSFKKAVSERPKEWSEGFIHYYNNQGYGKKIGAKGLEGTINVLEARHQLESNIYSMLGMEKYKLDNSEFNEAIHRRSLEQLLF